MPKILCPFHNDRNPSMEVYSGGIGFCFVCGKRAQLGDSAEVPKVLEKEPEDLEASLARIRQLPTKEVRGLTLPCNSKGYYVLWENYYKFRSFEGEPRYLAPRGHKQPLLWCRRLSSSKGLIIVEGELNALSLAELDVQWDIVSPGSAGNFKSQEEELLQIAEQYSYVVVWCDFDAPGIQAIWGIVPKLKLLGKDVRELTPNEDANDYLVKCGKEGLMQVIAPFITGGI